MANQKLTASELLIDSEHGPRLHLTPDAINLWRDGTHLIAQLEAHQGGLASLSLFDGNGTERINLYIESDGTPTLALNDGNEAARLECWIGRMGKPFLQLHDAQHM